LIYVSHSRTSRCPKLRFFNSPDASDLRTLSRRMQICLPSSMRCKLHFRYSVGAVFYIHSTVRDVFWVCLSLLEIIKVESTYIADGGPKDYGPTSRHHRESIRFAKLCEGKKKDFSYFYIFSSIFQKFACYLRFCKNISLPSCVMVFGPKRHTTQRL
jgi:hypothetical protein